MAYPKQKSIFDIETDIFDIEEDIEHVFECCKRLQDPEFCGCKLRVDVTVVINFS